MQLPVDRSGAPATENRLPPVAVPRFGVPGLGSVQPWVAVGKMVQITFGIITRCTDTATRRPGGKLYSSSGGTDSRATCSMSSSDSSGSRAIFSRPV